MSDKKDFKIMRNVPEVEDHPTKNRTQQKIYRNLAIIFGIILLICIGILVRNYLVEKKAQDNFTKYVTETEEPTVESEVPTETETEGLNVDIPEKTIDWDGLTATCKDIYAWIYIPNTQVDYPIVQSSEDMEEDYYLDHNLDGSSGYPGCIYTQKLNSKDFSDYNTVIYGHNMKNGTMFKTLHNFEDQTFFNDNQYCFIYMPDGKVKVYQIYAAYTFSDAHILKVYGCDTEDSFQSYLDMINPSNYSGFFRDGVSVTAQDKIITLSTCTNSSSTRYLVQGVYLGEK